MADRFVSQSELEEARNRRQAEWERVRQPHEPIEAPEEVEDQRSLYERLKEVKDKKQEEFDEARKFKNMFRGLESDETDFLSMVSKAKVDEENKKRQEEQAILKEVDKVRMGSALPGDKQPELIAILPQSSTSRHSRQAQLLSTAIRRKRPSSEDLTESAPSAKNNGPTTRVVTAQRPSAVQIIGVIPGMDDYSASSSDVDSDSSSESGDALHLPTVIQSTSSDCGNEKNHSKQQNRGNKKDPAQSGTEPDE